MPRHTHFHGIYITTYVVFLCFVWRVRFECEIMGGMARFRQTTVMRGEASFAS
jgi:hypothetical protein